MKAFLPLALGAIFFGAILARGEAQTLANGTFESWGTVAGTPPKGTPTGWNVGSADPVQAPGLVAGSTFSALIQDSTSGIAQSFGGGAVSSLQLSFVFAATDPGSTSARSFSLILGTGATNALNLRTVRGSAPGELSLQAFNGANNSWTTLAADAFTASTYDSASNSFPSLSAYDFSISLNLAASSYSITYGLVGGPSTTLSNLSIFQTAATTVSSLTLGSGSAAAFALDNMAVAAVPEPGSSALVAGALGLGVFGLSLRRRFGQA